jgi:steroid delta-isomerase-like uncharacterized protein
MNSAKALIQKYYESFNHQNVEGMLSCLHQDVIHDVNEGDSEVGAEAFRKFLHRMNIHYKEHLTNMVIMVDETGRNGSARFTVEGEYLKTDGGLPPARGQRYSIPAVGVFEIENQKIKRVTTYYNLKKWIEAVK